jgi:tRNA (adenine57-N1/adenine58-N1)-methyltransferase
MRGPIKDGELLVLTDRKEREYLVRVKAGERFHSHHGFIDYDALIDLPEGCTILSSRGQSFWVFRPTLAQIIMNMPRQAQVIYPKDIGVILMWGDIFPGATVVEIGTGYGALTLALIRAVGPQGGLFSYEVREDFFRAVQQTVSRYFTSYPQWTIHLQDAKNGLQEKNVDRILIDVPEPWEFLAVIKKALRPGGILLCFTANALQVKSLYDGLQAVGGFVLPDTLETLLRPWHVKGLSVRPAHRMTAHTGFITTVRRACEPNPDPEGTPPDPPD